MMIPSLLVVGVGRRGRIPIPVPVFLLWPPVFLAIGLIWILRLPAPRGSSYDWALGTALHSMLLLFHLSGMVVDVRANDGPSVVLRFI